MKTLNGLTSAKWTELYERAEWKQRVLSACHAIACCEHAHPQEREIALAYWGTLLTDGIVVEAPVDGDFRPFPVVVRDTHMSIVSGRKGPLDKELRQAMSERLEGVKQIVFAVTNFKKVDELDETAAAFVPSHNASVAN